MKSAPRSNLHRTLVLGLVALAAGCGPEDGGNVQRLEIPAPSLAGSVLPNPPSAPALVCLPPGYAASARDYPVVYYLPGFTTEVTEYVDGTFAGFHLGQALDSLVARGTIEPMLVVVVHGRNALGGSFYVDSPVTGKWEQYVVHNVVPFVESRYRVRRDPAGRGLAGESMGGFGALHLAMRHPDLFGAVFAMSPALFDERGLEDYGILSQPYREAWLLEQERMHAWPAGEGPRHLAAFAAELYAADGRFNYRRGFAYAYGAAFAPDPQAGPPYVAYPFRREDGRIVEDAARLDLFRAGCGDLAGAIHRHEAALRELRGIGLDVGRNDALAWVPRGARRFADLLAQSGIPCRWSEHDGGHVDRLGERIESEMLPFFSSTLGDTP